MKTGKRILSIFLVVLMLLTAAPLAGFVGLEITPKAMRFRKIILDELERKRARSRAGLAPDEEDDE